MYILSGPDDFSLNQSLEEIKKSVGNQSALAVSTTTLEGQQVTVEQLRPLCEAMPFLSEKRLVIISGLLERFEPRGRRSGRQGRTARVRDHQAYGYQTLGEYISGIPESTVVVLIEKPKWPLLSTMYDISRWKIFFKTYSPYAIIHSLLNCEIFEII